MNLKKNTEYKLATIEGRYPFGSILDSPLLKQQQLAKIFAPFARLDLTEK